MTILVIKSVWKQKWPQPRITASVGLVVIGCLIAGAGDLTFDGAAYAFAFSSVLAQALYLLLVEFQVRCSGSALRRDWHIALSTPAAVLARTVRFLATVCGW
jgi:hypothetical protein